MNTLFLLPYIFMIKTYGWMKKIIGQIVLLKMMFYEVTGLPHL